MSQVDSQISVTAEDIPLTTVLRTIKEYKARYGSDKAKELLVRINPNAQRILDSGGQVDHTIPQNPQELDPGKLFHASFIEMLGLDKNHKYKVTAKQIIRGLFPEIPESILPDEHDIWNLGVMLSASNLGISNQICDTPLNYKKSLIGAAISAYREIIKIETEQKTKFETIPALNLPEEIRIKVPLFLPDVVNTFDVMAAVDFAQRTEEARLPTGYKVQIPPELQTTDMRAVILPAQGCGVREIETIALHENDIHFQKLVALYNVLRNAFNTVSEEKALNPERGDFIKLEGHENFLLELKKTAKLLGVGVEELDYAIVQIKGGSLIYQSRQLGERFDQAGIMISDKENGSYLDTKGLQRRMEILRERIEECAVKRNKELSEFFAQNSEGEGSSPSAEITYLETVRAARKLELAA